MLHDAQLHCSAQRSRDRAATAILSGRPRLLRCHIDVLVSLARVQDGGADDATENDEVLHAQSGAQFHTDTNKVQEHRAS